MRQCNTSIAELSREAGVSLDIIKKLRTRAGSSTNVETATKIAAYYGKNMQQFLQLEDTFGNESALVELFGLLTPEERVILVRQVRGMIAGRH